MSQKKIENNLRNANELESHLFLKAMVFTRFDEQKGEGERVAEGRDDVNTGFGLEMAKLKVVTE
jgi:hypothetical protein